MTDSYHFQIEPEPRAEVPKFRVGGVYRDGRGLACLVKSANCKTMRVTEWVGDCWAVGDCRHELADGRFSVYSDRDSWYHLIPGELVQRDGQWVPLEQTASLTFPSGAALQVSGDKIVGRVEAELSEWDNVKPGAIINIRKPAQYITRTDAATYAAPTGNRLMTAADIRAAIDAALLALAGHAGSPVQRAPLPNSDEWRGIGHKAHDTFGADFIVTKGEVPTAPLHTSPTTDSAYPAIAGLLRG